MLTLNHQDVSALFKEKTSSGSMVINDAIVHLSVDTLPFGGVGPRNVQERVKNKLNLLS